MAATLQRKCSGGIIFVIITKITTEIIVPWNYFVIVSAKVVNLGEKHININFCFG